MTLADWFLYLVILLLLPWLFWYFWQPVTRAMQADIHVNGQFHQRVSLQENQTLIIHGELGDSILQIKDGKIRFKDSPCTIKRCVHSGWLKQSGEFTACIPNKVSIVLLGSETQKFDSINF